MAGGLVLSPEVCPSANRSKTERNEYDQMRVSVACIETTNPNAAASLGLEPRQRDPESLVLPLHHEARTQGDKT